MSSTDPANTPQSNQSVQSTQSRSRRGRGRGGIRGRGRGRGGQGGGAQQRAENSYPDVRTRPQPQAEPVVDKPDSGDDTDPDAEVCFICAEPIKYTSIAPCNHRTCYICSLRMRALYKTKDCPHCRTSAPYVIFTNDNADDGKAFDDYSDKDIAITDDNIGIKYTLNDIASDAVFFLHYNCPDSTCEYQGLGWPDLHRHVKSEHHKRLCDLCSRNKKVFTHEHVMFTDKELQTHNSRGDDRPGAVDQTGFKGHPMCEFCRERFYDDDKLYEHCRNKHERCFLCDRSNPARPHYFRNYDELEKHFRTDHYLCMDKECLEKKFVVFGSEMDLKGHQLSEHRDSVSKDVRRDAMTVSMSSFDYRPSYQHERRGGASSRHGSGRGRDPNAEPPPASSSHQHLRRDEIAFQRQLAVRTAQSLRPRTFGGHLTTSETADAPSRESSQSNSHPRDSNATASASSSSGRVQTTLQDAMGNTTMNDPASMSAEERARLVRHGAVLERAGNLLGNEPNKLSTFRTHVGCYQRGSFTANQLIDSFFTLFSHCSTTALGTLVREVADLYEDKKKGSDLLKAWQDWRAINEDYPSLPSLGNMHGGSSSSISGGWASTVAAAAPVLRVTNTKQALRLKKSTRASKISTNNRQTSIGYIAGPSPSSRAAPPQQSTQAFPALPKVNVTASDSSAARSAAAGWGAAVTRSTGSTGSTNPTSTQKGKKVQISSEEAFPSLPAAPKPQTTIFGYGKGAVRRDFGQTQSTGFEWGGNNASSSSNKDKGELGGSDDEEQEGGKKGKKGKKKGKQVLVAWG